MWKSINFLLLSLCYYRGIYGDLFNVDSKEKGTSPPFDANSLPWNTSLVRHHFKDGLNEIVIDENEDSILNSSFHGFAGLPIAQFNTSETRLSIVDLAARGFDGKVIIQRMIVNLDRPGIFVSEAMLRVPESAALNETLKTTDLPIDYTFLDGYSLALASPAFATGSLPLRRNATGDLLVIGVGGAQTNNFLHNAFPQLNITAIEIQPTIGFIARKYFGFQDDPKQRLFIMDGLKFLEDAANQGLKYQALYIDACPSVYPDGEVVLCPGKGFLNKTNILNMKEVLTDTGTFSIKMLLITENVTDDAIQISEPFREVFGRDSCVIVPMISRNNRVLICINGGVDKRKLNVERVWNEVMTFHAPSDWIEGIVKTLRKPA